MISTRWLAIILLVFLTGTLAALISAEGGVREIPKLLERVGIVVPPFISVPSPPSFEDPTTAPTDKPAPINSPGTFDLKSGTSRFSQDTCNVNTDCFVGGCSGEVCGSQPDIVSTCEYSSDFPNATTHQCGCVDKRCAWTRN